MKTYEQNKGREQDTFTLASNRAKQILKPGDRIRVGRCGGKKVTITFARWDGPWIVSKSGGDDYAANHIDKLNGLPISFNKDANKSL